MRKIFRNQPVTLLPIQQVMEDQGVVFLRQQGDARFARSPFRDDSSATSFSISVSRNCWKDWHLDIGGGPVEFIAKLCGMDYIDAADFLSKKYFSNEETDNFTSRVKLYVPPVKKSVPAEILDKGYRIFLDNCTLSEEARHYLKDERFLTDEEIEQFGFKSYPTRAIKHRVIGEMTGEGIDPLDIPGFYFSLETNGVTFVGDKKNSILIPIRNTTGQIIALQYRKRDIKDNESRYSWFSSSFYSGENEFGRNGSSPGSPVNVDKGRLRKPQTVLITEGIFKILAVRKQWGIPTISVQGVGNWRPAISELNNLKEVFPTIKRVVIAYDSDFRTNPHVKNAAIRLKDEVKNNGFSVGFLSWSPEHKGIDDFLYNTENPQNKDLWTIEENLQ